MPITDCTRFGESVIIRLSIVLLRERHKRRLKGQSMKAGLISRMALFSSLAQEEIQSIAMAPCARPNIPPAQSFSGRANMATVASS
jgi:hypothetical protein